MSAHAEERQGSMIYRYGRDGSLTILDARKARGTMRTVLYVAHSPATDAYWERVA